MTGNGGRPTYADDGSSTELWHAEAARSAGWAADARIQARRYHRRQMLMGWAFLALALLLLVGVAALIVMFIIELSR